MRSVYDLATVKPHVPPRRRYQSTEWVAYCEGYYQALVMALQVMQAAWRRWEERPMTESRLHLANPTTLPPAASAPATPSADAWPRTLGVVLAVVGSVFVLECLVLLGALIYRAVR